MRLMNKQKKKRIRRGLGLVVAFAMLLNEPYIRSVIDSIPSFESDDNGGQTAVYAAEVQGDDPEYTHN